jgi:hypothetical protein
MNICPIPRRWHEIHQQLLTVSAERNVASPPRPLILNGWVFSNDIEKANRWTETVNWAKQHDLVDLVTLVFWRLWSRTVWFFAAGRV